jgi:hypothetical protein
MSYFIKNRDPNHPNTKKLLALSHEDDSDDSGSHERELSSASEDMYEFAQRARKEREQRLHGGAVKRRAKGTQRS